MLTAWGFASAFGPLLIAYMRQLNGTYRGALHIIAGVMLVSAVLPVLVSPPQTAAMPPMQDSKPDSAGQARVSVYAKNGQTDRMRPAQ
jgi:hypothetical protein